MSLFNRTLGPPPTLSDDAFERYLAGLSTKIELDPLFKRRLRSDAINRFVAAREGLDTPARAGNAGRRMGRVGRACLYASLTLGVSAASVLAASQEALPGDALYGLKQRVEQLRMDIVPEQVKAELAAYALGERIEEMSRLAESGRLELAIAMGPSIEREFRHVAALGRADDPARAARIARHLLVLEGLLAQLPANARAAIQDVIDGTSGGQGSDGVPNSGNAGGVNANGGGGAAGAGSNAGPGPVSEPAPLERPDRTPRPEPTAKPEPTERPDRTPKPAQTESAEPPNQPVELQSSD